MDRRKRKERLSDSHELNAPLLLNDGGSAHPNMAEADFVYRDSSWNTRPDAGGAGEMIEMSNRGGATKRKLYRRRQSNPGYRGESSLDGHVSPAPDDDDECFVWHEIEPHHTISGIALAYRVNVDLLMKFNELRNAQELHTLKRLAIPAARHGALFNNPDDFISSNPADVGAITHTTAKPRAAEPSETANKKGLIMGDGEADQDGVRGASWRNPEDDNGRRSKTPTSPATFFRQFDSQMHRAVSAIDDTIQRQNDADGGEGGNGRYVLGRVQEADETPSWKVFAVAVAAVVGMSVAGFLLYDNIKAPDPGGGHISGHILPYDHV